MDTQKRRCTDVSQVQKPVFRYSKNPAPRVKGKEKEMRKEFYNIEDATGTVHKILVYGSLQHIWSERELQVGKRSKAWNLPEPCHAVAPTPYYPRIIFTL